MLLAEALVSVDEWPTPFRHWEKVTRDRLPLAELQRTFGGELVVVIEAVRESGGEMTALLFRSGCHLLGTGHRASQRKQVFGGLCSSALQVSLFDESQPLSHGDCGSRA